MLILIISISLIRFHLIKNYSKHNDLKSVLFEGHSLFNYFNYEKTDNGIGNCFARNNDYTTGEK